MHWDESEIFKILPFYDSYIEKPKIKKLSNVELLTELRFYDELSIVKNKNAFSGYARSYKIEIVDKKDKIVQLKASKINIVELFKELLIELKGFKYQITLLAFLSKVKSKDLIVYSPADFNSLAKTVVSDGFKLDECSSEIVFRIENWISHGRGWIVEEIVSQYLNVSSYLPLSGSTYVKLPKELSHSMKGLINIQNDDNKCFLWPHVRHLNCDGKNLWRITKKNMENAETVDSEINNDCFYYTSKYQDHVSCSFAYKLVCVNDKFSKDIVLYRGKIAVFKFIQCIFGEYSYCKDVMKKHFNKRLVMTAEQKFERINICWICDKLINIGDNKVRDHCHVTGKYRGAAHWSCNINLKISRKLVVIFQNLKGYDSHLIFKVLSKFNCSVSVVPNGLEKYMSFTQGKNIVFIHSMLFLNSSLDKLVGNLGSEDFKYLSEVFSREKLELIKKKDVYSYEYFDSFEKFKESRLPDIDCFFSSLKDCGISEKEYQRACVMCGKCLN